MRVVYSPAHRLHDPAFEVASGQRVPALEVPARAEAIRAALAADPAFELVEPAGHGLEPILAVHDPGMVRFLQSAWDDWRAWGERADEMIPDVFPLPAARGGAGTARAPHNPGARMGWWCFDTATAIGAGTWDAARASVDAAVTAAAHVLDGDKAAYALCRPPGHHAARAAFGGYCYVNNAAIAAQWLVARGAGRVGILDLDFHHGNGTQAIFWERGDVPYASIHGDPGRVYPYVAGHADEKGGGRGTGATFNQPLPAGVDDAAFLAALERALDWLAGRIDGIVIVSLGIDTYRHDQLGDFALTAAAYREAGRRVAAGAERLLAVQEGGYFVPDLGDNVRQWLRGAAGLD